MIHSRSLGQQCLSARALLPASHDNLFSSVLGLMEVRGTAYQHSLDLFAACTSPAVQAATPR